MKHDELTGFQHTLRQTLVQEGIAAVLTALKKALPEQTDKYNLVFHIEARLNTVNKDRIRGILSREQMELGYNRMTADTLDLINGLQVADFDVTTASKSGAPNKTGAVLYQIPHTMIMDGITEYRCIVRLAYNEEVIVESLDLTKDTVLKPVRVSEVMEVELKDPGISPAFTIKPANSTQQFLEEKTYTEWQFFIKPLRAGAFPLLLLVVVKEISDNRERKREIVLEEMIQVVTETAGVSADTGRFQQAGFAFFYTTAPARERKGLAWVAGLMAKLKLATKIVLVTAIVAAGVLISGIWRVWIKNPDPKPGDNSTLSVQADSSDWRQAVSLGTDSSFSGYIRNHPDGIFLLAARAKLDSILEANSITVKPPPKPKIWLEQLHSRRSGFRMVEVQGGVLTLENHYEKDNCTAKKVNIRDFKIGKYEVTQADWELIMNANPSFKGSCDTCPVENVSWQLAQEFIQVLNRDSIVRTSGKKYRLPYELEWEYAARGGRKSNGFKYAGSNRPGEVAWFNTIKEHSHEVGLKNPNELGIYDMSGNVREWCQGVYPLYLSCENTVSEKKVLRGGSWVNPGNKLRVTYRSKERSNHKDEQSGFRLIEYD